MKHLEYCLAHSKRTVNVGFRHYVSFGVRYAVFNQKMARQALIIEAYLINQ